MAKDALLPVNRAITAGSAQVMTSICRQGPHHVAIASTINTDLFARERSIAASKDSAVNAAGLAIALSYAPDPADERRPSVVR
jgi:hypothetical protein